VGRMSEVRNLTYAALRQIREAAHPELDGIAFSEDWMIDPVLSVVAPVDRRIASAARGSNSLVSVLIPSQASWDELSPVLKSLEACRDDHLEIVIFDDSEDSRLSVPRDDFELTIRVITRFEAYPIGAGRARRRLLEDAQGEIVLFLDDDMMITSGVVAAARLSLLDSGSAPSVVAFPLLIASPHHDDEGVDLSPHRTLRRLRRVISEPGYVESTLLARHNALLAVRKSVIRGHGLTFPDILRGQDSAFAGQLARLGAVVYVPAHCAVFHAGPTTSTDPAMSESDRASYLAARQFIGLGENPGHTRSLLEICGHGSWAVPMVAIRVHLGRVPTSELPRLLLDLRTSDFRDFIVEVCDCVPNPPPMRSELVRVAQRDHSLMVTASAFEGLRWNCEWQGDFWGTSFSELRLLLWRTYEAEASPGDGRELDFVTYLKCEAGHLVRSSMLRRGVLGGRLSPEWCRSFPIGVGE
jgi:glycosyltransferase involved in cell wall biosynthesis